MDGGGGRAVHDARCDRHLRPERGRRRLPAHGLRSRSCTTRPGSISPSPAAWTRPTKATPTISTASLAGTARSIPSAIRASGIDFTRGNDVAADGDTGYSVGGAVVQTIEGYGTELYSQVRWYTLDRDDAKRRRHRGWHARDAGEVLMRSWHESGLHRVARARPGRAPACRSGRPTRRETIPRSRRVRACSPARRASWSSSAAEKRRAELRTDMPQTMKKRNSHDCGPDHA